MDATLAASDAVTLDDIAAIIGEIEEAPVTYQDGPVEDCVAARGDAGMPEPFAQFTAAWFRAIAPGGSASLGDVERLIDRPSTAISDFLSERRRAGRGPA